MKKERIAVPLDKLQLNKGQIEWLPQNPRQWTDDSLERMIRSLEEDPDFMEDRPPLITPLPGRKGFFVVFGGNERVEGEKRRKAVKALECYVYIPENEDDRQTIIRRSAKDNGHYGAYDWDIYANEWADFPMEDWGVPAWPQEGGGFSGGHGGGDGEGDGLGEDEKPKEPKEKIEFVEELLKEAMRENVREATEQIEYTMKRGWIASFFTKGAAQAKFLRAKYYGERYPQYLSLYFCPERFFTSANTRSCYDQFKKIADGADDGIAGLRTVSGDNLLLLLLKGSYPFGGARMPMDFPAVKARELIEEFGGRKGCTVLDPCHGWGGRLCGALMADVSLYYGVDPSPEAHRGLEKERDAFLPYCPDSRVEIVQECFEDTDLAGRVFDMAITSPPYFDVEQYHGENQSHVRYNQYEKWVDGFYRPLISKTHDALRPGGVFVLQVGGQSYPLIEDGKRIAEEVGFTVEDVRPLGGGTKSALHNRTDDDEDNEKVIILRKGL